MTFTTYRYDKHNKSKCAVKLKVKKVKVTSMSIFLLNLILLITSPRIQSKIYLMCSLNDEWFFTVFTKEIHLGSTRRQILPEAQTACYIAYTRLHGVLQPSWNIVNYATIQYRQMHQLKYCWRLNAAVVQILSLKRSKINNNRIHTIASSSVSRGTFCLSGKTDCRLFQSLSGPTRLIVCS